MIRVILTHHGLLLCCDWSSKSSHNPLPQQLKMDIFILQLVRHIRWQLSIVTPFHLYGICQPGIQKSVYMHPH